MMEKNDEPDYFLLFYDFEELASYLYSVNKHFLLFGGNRETVTSVWTVAHD